MSNKLVFCCLMVRDITDEFTSPVERWLSSAINFKSKRLTAKNANKSSGRPASRPTLSCAPSTR